MTPLALVATLLVGCAPVQVAPPARMGAPCSSSAACDVGLVCKGARCDRPRSLAAGVCVTDGGCAEGLRCMNGHCATREASAEECGQACDHVEAMALGALLDEADVASEEARIVAVGAAASLREACLDACLARGTLERTQCLRAVQTIDDVATCP